MGVAGALSPAPAKASANKAPAVAQPRVLQVRPTSHLLQRACECGAAAGLSGRCDSCDRVGLEARPGGEYARATADIATAAPAAVQTRPDQTRHGRTPVGHDFGRVGIHAPAAISSAASASAGGTASAGIAPLRLVRTTAPARAQAQLHVSSPGDPAEQEAQVIGKLIAHMPEPAPLARAAPPVTAAASGDPQTVYRKETGPPTATPDVMASLKSAPSGGAPLPRNIRNFMELRFGADFGAVRVHTGEHAELLCGQLSARAFTIGHDIYFGKGQFRTDIPEGWELIAHELTHTIQQGSVVQPAIARTQVPEPAKPAAPAQPARPSAATPAARVPRVVEPIRPPAPVPVAKPPAKASAPPALVVKPLPSAATTRADQATPPGVRAADAKAVKAVTPQPAAAPVRAAPTPVAAPAQRAAPTRIAERAPQSIQRIGIDDLLGSFADLANMIPGFRMLTLVLGINPITMAPVDRSVANLLRALVELIPGGGIITQALQNSGVFDKAGAWISDQIATLGMTGAALKQALMSFLSSLSLSDIFHPGDVWDRAKRIFTEPIDRLIAFVKGLVDGILKMIKDAILLPLAKLAEGTPSWDLLTAVIGTNPITGETVQRTPEKLIGGFLKLIHQDEIWANMQKSNAIPRAWAWFQNAMSTVIAFVSQIPDKFSALFKSLTIEDVVTIVGVFQKVASVFGGFVGNFISWAGTALWNLLEIIFDVVSPGAFTYVKKTGNALHDILKNPLPFVHNLVAAAKLGLQNFVDHFGTHLKEGLIDWLTGSLPGVYIPKALSLVEFGKFALSVLGITWAQIRAKIVKALGPNGETIMKGLETAFDIVVALVKGGIAAAWELIKEKLTNLKDMVIDGIVSFVTDSIIKKAVPKLIAMFVPGAGFISAIISIYDTIKVFIEKLAKIAALVKSFIDSIVAIAAGEISGAASRVESALAGVLSLAINFLAGFFGLSDVAAKVMEVVKKVHDAVDKALDTAIAWIIGKAKALFASVKAAAQGIVNWWSGRNPFTASDNSQHSLYFAGTGPQATLTVSTVPTPVEAFLANVAAAVNASTDTKAQNDLAAAQGLWNSSIKVSIGKLNAAGAAAPAPADVDKLNDSLRQLANLLRSLVVFDPRSAAAPPGAIPVKVNDLIKLNQLNQVAVVISIGKPAAGAPGLTMINWNILRPRSKSVSTGASTASVISGWGTQYELYVDDPRETYLGPTPDRTSTVGDQVRQRMQRQGKYDPATGTVSYNRDARGKPLSPGQAAQQLNESQCDMGHLIDAVTWWNSNGRLTYPQSPDALKFMNDPNNYELEPSSINRLRGAQLGVKYLPPIG